jgi:hypothetical protein
MLAHELERAGSGQITLQVTRRDDVEREPELLEDRPPLR